MTKQLSELVLTCLLTVGIAFEGALSGSVAMSEEPASREGYAGTDQRRKVDLKKAEEYAVIWEEPADIESRDLFHGIGGREGAPDPSRGFVFIRRNGSADDTNEKIDVRDDLGRKWTVKFGREVRSEIAATRIVWAAGYHVDQDYLVERAHIEGRGGFDVLNVRFERDDDGFTTVGRWRWNSNPFVGTRELDGLKTLMALLNNFDVRTGNTKIVRPKKKIGGDPNKRIYYVNDLGATLGTTGAWFTQAPLLGLISAGTEGVPNQFAKHRFIEDARNGDVRFHIKRTITRRELRGVKAANARWMGNLLARLSDNQISDAFRAGGFNVSETATYLRAIRARIVQLQELE